MPRGMRRFRDHIRGAFMRERYVKAILFGASGGSTLCNEPASSGSVGKVAWFGF
jgi:hypothetical protein